MARLATTLEEILRLECLLDVVEEAGERAARCGKDETACRHPAGSLERDAWMKGYAREKEKMDTTTSHQSHNVIAKPAHYQSTAGFDALDVIEHYGYDASFHLGNTLKYLLRAGKKDGGAYLQDLQKAAEYIRRFEKFDHEIGVTEWPRAIEDVETVFASVDTVLAAFEIPPGYVADAIRTLLRYGADTNFDDDADPVAEARDSINCAIAQHILDQDAVAP